jgi:hypothetical protein
MVNQNNITEFFKLLVEFGGCYYVDNEMFIKSTVDDTPVLVKINNNPMPMKVYHENMKVGKYTIFNPLVEVLGHSAERTWFIQSRSLIVGVMIKEMMKKVVNIVTDKDEDFDYDKLDAIQPFVKKIDKKLLSEIDKLEPVRILRIIYNKKKRIAQAQSDLWEEEYRNTLKIRKGSWSIIPEMLEAFIGTDEVHEIFNYKATIVGMQETDAFLHVLLQLAIAMDQYVKLLLDRDLRVPEFVNHMEHLEEYRKACAWAVAGTAQHDKEAAKPVNATPPWQKQSNIPDPHNRFIPQTQGQGFVTNEPMIQSEERKTPHADPAMFARMAKILEANPFADVNQVMANMNQQQMYGGYGQQNMIQSYGGGSMFNNSNSLRIPTPREEPSQGLPTPKGI